jgi:peptidoglycan/LPS O-acetylase OafA/YrhL
VVVSVILGAICYWFDPFFNGTKPGLLTLIGITLIGITLLPSPDVRGWGETHSLDGPCWSLFQEYIANFLYAVFGRKLSKVVLWIVVVVSGVVLIAVSIAHFGVATGWGYSTFWIGFVRMMFPFFAGLLLFRTGKLIKVRHAYVVCSLILILLFFLPAFKYNGLYEAACIIIAFPIVVAAGAGGSIDGRWAKLCNFSGAISYPIYILHYPFIYIYTYWVAFQKPDPKDVIMIASILFVFLVLLAFVMLKFYDEPIRNWLKKNWLSRQSTGN